MQNTAKEGDSDDDDFKTGKIIFNDTESDNSDYSPKPSKPHSEVKTKMWNDKGTVKKLNIQRQCP